MSIEVKVPVLPESVADATIATWHKKVGDKVKRDENLVDLETDKVVLEVPAPKEGILAEILFQEGDTVQSSQVLARIDSKTSTVETMHNDKSNADADADSSKKAKDNDTAVSGETSKSSHIDKATGPASRRTLAENDLQAQQIASSKTEGRITKEDVLRFIEQNRNNIQTEPNLQTANQKITHGNREEQRVPMSRLRKKVSERLLQTLSTAAMLTTFNEVNLKAVMELRQQYKDSFEKKHGVKLGFMSFFTKAVIEALKRFPAVNASIDGEDIVYHGYYDIGIAVSTERGLVVPVIKEANHKSMAAIEKNILEAANKAREGKLTIEEMQGGTFTITNGGVFGSLLSTPIINPPQTGILGMHKIEERPVVEKGQIVIRPMMYIAFSYDHRLIDGRESVQFLVAVKELLEDPARLLLEV